MFEVPSMFRPPSMFGPPSMFTGVAQAASGVESTWCLSFDGVDDHCSIIDSSTYRPAAITVSAWVYVTAYTTRGGIAYSFATTTPSGGSWGLAITSTGAVHWNAGSNDYYETTSGAVPVNTWTHVTATFNGSSRKCYINGSDTALSRITTMGGGWTAGTSIGRLYAGTGYYLNGRIDDFRIYSSALSSTEVTALYTNASPTTTGLTFYLPMEEGTGTTTVDAIGGVTATLTNGPVWHPQTPPKLVSGRVASARSLSFDGVNDYVDVNSISAVNSASQLTIAFWCKKSSSSADVAVGSRVSATNGVWLQWYSDGFVYWNPRNGSAYGNYYALPYSGSWVHLCGVYDGSQVAANRLRIYVNGAQVTATLDATPPSALSSNAGSNWNIGGLSDGVFLSTGLIDDPRVFSRALSATEVQKICRGQNPATNDPVGWWPFDEESGTTAVDSGSGGNNGTHVNGPTISTDVPAWLSA